MRAAAALGLAMLALPASAAQASFNSTPDPSIMTNGLVTSIAQTGGKTFLGGRFTRAGTATGGGADLGQSGGAPNFAFAKPNGAVLAVVSDGGGGWYIGGAFTTLGSSARTGLAHLRPDGTVDPSFDAGLNAGAAVVALALSGQTLYVAGNFTSVNAGAVARSQLAAFDTTSGQATAFDPNIGDEVDALTVAGSTLYVGGQFTSVGSPAVTRDRVAAYDTTTGALTGFDPNVAGPVSAGSGVVAVRALAVSGGALYAAGHFSTVNGATSRLNAAAFDLSTATATAFAPSTQASGTIDALAVAGGVAYVGGLFSHANNGATVRNGIAAFDATTGALTSFDPNVNGTVDALAASGTTVYAGGGFINVNATAVPRSRIAAFDASSGTVIAGFDPNVDGEVDALAVGPGQRIYAGGGFSFAGAATLRGRIAAVDADGTLDTTFAPDISNTVLTLAASGGTVYVGGNFNVINGTTTRNNIAAFDAATGALTPFDPNVNGAVNDIALSGTTLYAGGGFTVVNQGTPPGLARGRLAAFDTTTGAATGFDPQASDTVDALALGGGEVYAGGAFLTVGASPTTRDRLAAFDPTTGAVAPAFDPNIGDDQVSALAYGNGKVYAGGGFSTVNGATTRNDIAAFDPTTGAVDPGFDQNVSGGVTALALSGPDVYAGGSFFEVNGATRQIGLAAFDAATGTLDPAFSPALNGEVDGLLIAGGELYAGGLFSSAGPMTQLDFAQFSTAPPPVVVTGAASAGTVSGTVDPRGSATAFVVEFGTSTAFGSITPPVSVPTGAGAVPVSASLSGLAAGTTYFYRVVATSSAGTSFGAVMSFTTAGAAVAPVVVTGAPVSVSQSGAVLGASVDPEGAATAFTFEYGTSTSFGQIAPVVELDSASSPEAVSGSLTGLAANTNYVYRVVATNAAGTSFGVVRSFTTGPGGVPVVSIGSAGSVTSSGAVLSGSVDSLGEVASFAFEYGPTTSFGSLSAIDRTEASAGPQRVSLPVSGLAPGTTYIYRLVATDADGTMAGPTATFTTPVS